MLCFLIKDNDQLIVCSFKRGSNALQSQIITSSLLLSYEVDVVLLFEYALYFLKNLLLLEHLQKQAA